MIRNVTVADPGLASLAKLHQMPAQRRLEFDGIGAERLTHYLFRFPAKFHAPVVHALIRRYSAQGATILDPFCGSGTALLAATVDNRNAIGADVDPLAVFVAKVKTHRYKIAHLRRSWELLEVDLEAIRRTPSEYRQRCFLDITLDAYQRELVKEELQPPAIPNLMHWFRRHIIIDLLRIRRCIAEVSIPETHRDFFRLMFASIIRRSSNADPVPVSGLEVTAHMKRLDAAGRVIDPFELLVKAARKGIAAAEQYGIASNARYRAKVLLADARSLSSRLDVMVDTVVTSPPYHNAVDYYRRHQLEMFWLDLTLSQDDRLALLPNYIGRQRVSKSDPSLDRLDELGPVAQSWHGRMLDVSVDRANAFAHYMLSMKDSFSQLTLLLASGSPAVFVLGNSAWNGSRMPAAELFVEITDGWFELEERLWYPIKNRYMSYGRRNGADINKEYVLVFVRA